jgi:lysyl oxidase
MTAPRITGRRTVFGIHAAACFALALVAGTAGRPSASPAAPDLIVRGDILSQQWVERDEDIGAVCSAEEGNVTPGRRRIVRFTVMTPNIGSADINLGDPNAHIAADDGLYEFASCHSHYHFRHYALYELIGANGYVWKAAKRGFCMLDTDPNPAYYGQAPKQGQFKSCGAIGIPGNQGISAGWADTYRFTLPGQYFVLDGGDGQPVVPEGNYRIRITVNPPFTAQNGEPCPNIDTLGFCHQLPESDYTNNTTEVPVFLPSHPGREGAGPLAGSNAAALDADCHDGSNGTSPASSKK